MPDARDDVAVAPRRQPGGYRRVPDPRFEQSTCAAGNKCAPCANPFTGADTGSCGTIGCDQAAPSTPFTFPGCCSNLGVCVPSTFPGLAIPSYVTAGDCPAGLEDYQCVSRDQIPQTGQTPTSCSLAISVIPPFSWDSFCVPNCVLGDRATFLPPAGCP